MTTQALIQLAMAFPASLGFALLFNLRPRLLVPASLGGLFTWAVYLACGQLASGVFVPCLVASAFAAVYAQVLAIRFKAPLAIFYIVCEIPLIPGSGLYYTMSYAVQGNAGQALNYGLLTTEFVFAIAWAGGEILRRFLAARATKK